MVIKGRVDKAAFKEAFKTRNLDSNIDVQTFLEQMVGDDQGYVMVCHLAIFLNLNFFPVLSTCLTGQV